MELKKAQRTQAKIKLALQGPSGSGKTMSALLLASGLISSGWPKIAVIDTENHSAELYSHLGGYNVLHLPKPFSPERYIEAIETCENAGMEVIIIDSITHEWDGSGGILEVHGNMVGNSFANWSKMTPRHNAFVQKILQCGCHVIATIRTKTDYALTERNGKYIPEKLGLKGITRDGMDYEFTVVFDLDIKHNARASKDRTGLFMDKPESIIVPGYGTRIKKWCESGVSLSDIKLKVSLARTIEDISKTLRAYPEYKDILEPLAIARKGQLSVDIVNLNKISGNGQQNDTGKSQY